MNIKFNYSGYKSPEHGEFVLYINFSAPDSIGFIGYNFDFAKVEIQWAEIDKVDNLPTGNSICYNPSDEVPDEDNEVYFKKMYLIDGFEMEKIYWISQDELDPMIHAMAND